jgi:hypothetical protein
VLCGWWSRRGTSPKRVAAGGRAREPFLRLCRQRAARRDPCRRWSRHRERDHRRADGRRVLATRRASRGSRFFSPPECRPRQNARTSTHSSGSSRLKTRSWAGRAREVVGYRLIPRWDDLAEAMAHGRRSRQVVLLYPGPFGPQTIGWARSSASSTVPGEFVVSTADRSTGSFTTASPFWLDALRTRGRLEIADQPVGR